MALPVLMTIISLTLEYLSPMSFSDFQTLVLVDPTVDRYEQLVSTVHPQTKVVVLQPDQDGIQQITEILAEFNNVESLHLVSHGYSGGLRLGSTALETADLDEHATDLAAWSSAFVDQPQILLYGCEVAAGEGGQAFVQRFSHLTKANIAASSHLTGSAELGGDWQLDYAIGEVTASLAFSEAAIATYDAVLAAPPGTSTSGSPNLIVNGNFAAGNTGFTSDLPYRGENTYPDDGSDAIFPPPPPPNTRGGYTIVNDAQPRNFLPGVVVAKPFPGDPSKGVPASNTYLYSNPNADKATPSTANSAFPNPIIWEQTVPVESNKTYSFLVYFDNLLTPTAPGADPLIDLQVDGTSLGAPIAVTKSPDDWVPVEYTFTTTAGQTSARLSIVDRANTLAGDDFGFTAVSAREAVPVRISSGTVTSGSSAGSLSASEAVGTLNIPITLNSAPDQDFVLNYTFGASGDTATNGQDYTGTPNPGQVTIRRGTTSAFIAVPIINDSVREGDERFTINFSLPTGNQANLVTSRVVTTIRDDEPGDGGGGGPTPTPPGPGEPSDGCRGRGRTRRGTSGNDTLSGTSGADTLRGAAGNDILRGRSCNDRIFGDSGNDQITGDVGRDTLNGGTGNDRINGGIGADTLGGGADNDQIRAGDQNDLVRGGTGRDRINGDSGNDTVNGGSQNDIVIGGLGDDLVIGAAGDDRLFGGAGDDRLIGALGRDRLNGGGGRDRFIYRRTNEGRDRIDRFVVTDDVIDLSQLFRGTTLESLSASDRFTQGVVLRAAPGGSTTVSFDSNGTAAGGLVNIAQINAIAPTSLTAANFVLA